MLRHMAIEIGRHGQIRTADLSLRRRPLYPSELRAHGPPIVAFEDEGRTRECLNVFGKPCWHNLIVGQIANLRPIVNRPAGVWCAPASYVLDSDRRITNPPQVNNLPHSTTPLRFPNPFKHPSPQAGIARETPGR